MTDVAQREALAALLAEWMNDPESFSAEPWWPRLNQFAQWLERHGVRVLAPGEVVVPLEPSEQMVEAAARVLNGATDVAAWALRAALRAAHEP